jgi:hypothetical protein
VTVVGDLQRELHETFFVQISNPSSGAVIVDSLGQGTIRNDDRVGGPGAAAPGQEADVLFALLAAEDEELGPPSG